MNKWSIFAGNHPFLIVLCLTLICLIFRIIDVFIFRIDELWGEIIISKALGFIIIVLYLWSVQKSIEAIGLHKTMIFQAFFIGTLVSVIIVFLYFITGFLILFSSEVEVGITFSPTDPKTNTGGGLLFGLWLVFGNVVNSSMEEGLFRGLMIRKYLTKLTFWKSNFLQATIFGIWHFIWPIKYYITGQMTLIQAIFNAIFIHFLASFLMGLVWGYMYFKTNSLWPSWICHFIWNSALNLITFNIQLGTDQTIVNMAIIIAGIVSILSALILMILIRYLANIWDMPVLKPWNQD